MFFMLRTERCNSLFLYGRRSLNCALSWWYFCQYFLTIWTSEIYSAFVCQEFLEVLWELRLIFDSIPSEYKLLIQVISLRVWLVITQFQNLHILWKQFCSLSHSLTLSSIFLNLSPPQLQWILKWLYHLDHFKISWLIDRRLNDRTCLTN